MADEAGTLEELLEVREALIVGIVGNMPDGRRRFLVSFERSSPGWSLVGLDGDSELPAIRWRRQNLDKLDTDRRGGLIVRLEDVLGG